MTPCACAGFLVMLRPDLATQPEALTAIICAAVLAAAPVTLTPYKYAVFLTLITFDSVVLCQYLCAHSQLQACCWTEQYPCPCYTTLSLNSAECHLLCVSACWPLAAGCRL